MFGVRDPIPSGSVRVMYTKFCMRGAIPITSVKPPSIFPYAYVSTMRMIGLLVYSNTRKILNNAIVYVRLIVLLLALCLHCAG